MADNLAHPDEATWERLALGELNDLERAAAFDHITACDRCSQIWRGLLMLENEARAQSLIPPAVPARAGWMRSPVMALALAATLVLVIGGVLLTKRPVNDQTRGSAAPAVEGLMMAVSAENVPNLVWAPISTATGYRVEVFSDDGRSVWSREVTAPPVAWPADVPHPPGKYRWRVDALVGGDVAARSRVSTLEIPR